MTGDRKAEIILIDPEDMRWYWLSSESDYTSINTFRFGSPRAVPL